jgi:hypothetical protein
MPCTINGMWGKVNGSTSSREAFHPFGTKKLTAVAGREAGEMIELVPRDVYLVNAPLPKVRWSWGIFRRGVWGRRR